ncbi:unnamed protein product [Rotaria sp. Silwood1]|nr:unnamed protein product [Rotaria sp. Silwood1]CAF4743399.1 unnamed protein product [Rotaria sp. Silwood1]CAF4836962.1 unnamed protein product [Rotaria sp. Silwood1]
MAVNNLTSHRRPPIIGVWVDQEIGRNGTHLDIKQRFARLSSFIEQWHYFVTPQELYDFLDDNPKTQIFLIMSGQNGQQIVPSRHSYENIHSIYIFCANVNQHRRLKEEFDKVKDVMNLIDNVYERIADELSQLLLNIGESYKRSDDRSLARNYLNEALRLMGTILHYGNNHGRVMQANDLLESIDSLIDP